MGFAPSKVRGTKAHPRQPSVGNIKGGGFGFKIFPSCPPVLAIGAISILEVYHVYAAILK
jgi:hypothetical protein